MVIDSTIAQAYCAGEDLDNFRRSWLFERTSIASDLGRNVFTAPLEEETVRETVRTLEARIRTAVKRFVPVDARFGMRFFPTGRHFSRRSI